LITQTESKDLFRDFVLPKTKAQLLVSRLQQWNLLEKGVKVSFHRKSQSNIVKYYSIDGDLAHCKDVCVLLEELQLQPAPEQWRIFTDSSKFSLKAILLHNGNKYPSIPLFHAVHMKET
jgi:hypothetical protein